MLFRKDATYYWIRAAEELERAQLSADATTASAHKDIARQYGTLAAEFFPASPIKHVDAELPDLPQLSNCQTSATR